MLCMYFFLTVTNKFDISKLDEPNMTKRKWVTNKFDVTKWDDKQKWKNNSANHWQIKEEKSSPYVLISGSGNIQAYYRIISSASLILTFSCDAES